MRRRRLSSDIAIRGGTIRTDVRFVIETLPDGRLAVRFDDQVQPIVLGQPIKLELTLRVDDMGKL